MKVLVTITFELEVGEQYQDNRLSLIHDISQDPLEFVPTVIQDPDTVSVEAI